MEDGWLLLVTLHFSVIIFAKALWGNHCLGAKDGGALFLFLILSSRRVILVVYNDFFFTLADRSYVIDYTRVKISHVYIRAIHAAFPATSPLPFKFFFDNGFHFFLHLPLRFFLFTVIDQRLACSSHLFQHLAGITRRIFFDKSFVLLSAQVLFESLLVVGDLWSKFAARWIEPGLFLLIDTLLLFFGLRNEVAIGWCKRWHVIERIAWVTLHIATT